MIKTIQLTLTPKSVVIYMIDHRILCALSNLHTHTYIIIQYIITCTQTIPAQRGTRCCMWQRIFQNLVEQGCKSLAHQIYLVYFLNFLNKYFEPRANSHFSLSFTLTSNHRGCTMLSLKQHICNNYRYKSLQQPQQKAFR